MELMQAQRNRKRMLQRSNEPKTLVSLSKTPKEEKEAAQEFQPLKELNIDTTIQEVAQTTESEITIKPKKTLNEVQSFDNQLLQLYQSHSIDDGTGPFETQQTIQEKPREKFETLPEDWTLRTKLRITSSKSLRRFSQAIGDMRVGYYLYPDTGPTWEVLKKNVVADSSPLVRSQTTTGKTHSLTFQDLYQKWVLAFRSAYFQYLDDSQTYFYIIGRKAVILFRYDTHSKRPIAIINRVDKSFHDMIDKEGLQYQVMYCSVRSEKIAGDHNTQKEILDIHEDRELTNELFGQKTVSVFADKFAALKFENKQVHALYNFLLTKAKDASLDFRILAPHTFTNSVRSEPIVTFSDSKSHKNVESKWRANQAITVERYQRESSYLLELEGYFMSHSLQEICTQLKSTVGQFKIQLGLKSISEMLNFEHQSDSDRMKDDSSSGHRYPKIGKAITSILFDRSGHDHYEVEFD